MRAHQTSISILLMFEKLTLHPTLFWKAAVNTHLLTHTHT